MAQDCENVALKGKILNIRWDGTWHVNIERVYKLFETHEEMQFWLQHVLNNARDPDKKQLLMKDVEYLWCF